MSISDQCVRNNVSALLCNPPHLALVLCKFASLMRTLLIIFVCLPLIVQASDEVVHFDDPVHMQMYKAMLKEYRCLKCQNQNLWDSNASLAGDLRREIRAQIINGKTKSEIDEYLVARYGEFVLYRPRFSAKTAVLWIGPFVLLFVGLASILLMVRQKSRALASEPVQLPDVHSDDKLAKARDLLGK